MKRLGASAVYPLDAPTAVPGPHEVYLAEEVEELLAQIIARTAGHPFAMGSDIRSLCERATKEEKQ